VIGLGEIAAAVVLLLLALKWATSTLVSIKMSFAELTVPRERRLGYDRRQTTIIVPHDRRSGSDRRRVPAA
jgi:hypothetical protein